MGDLYLFSSHLQLEGVVAQKTIFEDPSFKVFLSPFYLNINLSKSVNIRPHDLFISIDDHAQSNYRHKLSLSDNKMHGEPLTKITPRFNAPIWQTIEPLIDRDNQG